MIAYLGYKVRVHFLSYFSEVVYVVLLLVVVIVTILLLLEMLVRSEFTEQSEQHVEGLDDRLGVLLLVHWNVCH